MHTIKDMIKQLIGKSLDAYNKKYTSPINNRIDNIVAQAGTDNTEIVDARIDSAGVSHTTLNNRILAETKMNDEQLVEYTGSNISVEDTIQGYLKDVEILGNTIQNEEDLADIKSVGVLQEDGTYKMSILSCGKNIFPGWKIGFISNVNGSVEDNFTDRVRTDFIKIDCNKDYYISGLSNEYSSLVACYDENKNYLGRCAGSTRKAVSIPKNKFPGITGEISKYSYIAITQYSTIADVENFINTTNVLLEEGTTPTTYEPHQSSVSKLVLPCQLEKVGDVSDRLYYDDVEKAWCIEKNIVKVYLSTLSDWNFHSALTGNSSEYIAFSCRLPKNDFSDYSDGKAGNVICTVAPNLSVNNMHPSVVGESASEIEGVAINSIGNLFVKLLRTKADNVEKFESFITNHFVMYKITPQKIVLPLDVQIALNSFFGTTHVYMESGEVEGTIKCKIPKSLGATVQSLNNKTDILSDRIEAIEGLKDSQNMKYETDKGYLVCKETKNGAIDDLKIEGKTLVNLGIKDKSIPVNSGWFSACKDSSMLNPNTEYTIVSMINKPSDVDICLITNYGSSTQSIKDCVYAGKTYSINKIKLSSDTPYIHYGYKTYPSVEGVIISSIILEGDHTQNPPSYFEGLMSVGEDVDKIEVLSQNKNFCTVDNLIQGGYQVGTTPVTHTNATNRVALKVDNTIKGNSLYINSPYNIAIIELDKDNKLVYDALWLGVGKKEYTAKMQDCARLGVSFKKNDETNITVAELLNSKTTIASIQDKKQILFYNENGELEPVTELHEWDSIEKHSDNKWYYHKRSGKVVLDGSEDSRFNATYQNTLRFSFTDIFRGIKFIDTITSIKTISNSFKNIAANVSSISDIEGISVHSSSVTCINILKSKLSSQDVTGFKQWLQENNVTVVYQLAEEEVYELAPLHLDSYANETLILCNSGAISPKMEFSITSHINELVKAYGERVNLLEEKVYKYMVAQNRLQLASTYSADSVTFKVDYALCSEGEEEYNNDLYELILNNILVGKDNYDYDKMFNIILDYASWNQISWEQFDILVGLMGMQYNPPVEDIIEGDVIESEETPVE